MALVRLLELDLVASVIRHGVDIGVYLDGGLVEVECIDRPVVLAPVNFEGDFFGQLIDAGVHATISLSALGHYLL